MFKVNNKDTRMMPAMLLKIEKSVANGSPLTVLLFSQAVWEGCLFSSHFSIFTTSIWFLYHRFIYRLMGYPNAFKIGLMRQSVFNFVSEINLLVNLVKQSWKRSEILSVSVNSKVLTNEVNRHRKNIEPH